MIGRDAGASAVETPAMKATFGSTAGALLVGLTATLNMIGVNANAPLAAQNGTYGV